MITRNQIQDTAGGASGEGAGRSRGLDALLTVTGEKAKIEGKFQIEDSLQIECEIGGELEVGGRLVIGEKGTVNADVRTVDALIMGTYEGNMIATGNVEIASTGRVIGNLQTDSLVIEKGGFFNGNVASIDKKDRGEPKSALPARGEESKREVIPSLVSEFTEEKSAEAGSSPEESRRRGPGYGASGSSGSSGSSGAAGGSGASGSAEASGESEEPKPDSSGS